MEKISIKEGKVKLGEPKEISYLCAQNMDEIEMANSLSKTIQEEAPENARFYREIEGSRRLSSPCSNFVNLKIQYFTNNIQ